MIIKLTGANFTNSNIGTLNTWSIRVYGSGLTHSIPRSVDKDAALTNAIITINEGYELNGSVSVTMDGNAVTSGITTSGNTITISIASVTGNVVINVPTKNTATGEEGGNNSGSTLPTGNLMDTKSRLDANTEFISGTESTTQWGVFRGATPTIDGDCVKIDCANTTQTLAGIRMGVPASVSALPAGTKVKITFFYRHDESYTPAGEYKFYTSTSASSFEYTTEWQQFSKTYTWNNDWDRLQISSATTLQKEAIFYVKDFCIEVVN